MITGKFFEPEYQDSDDFSTTIFRYKAFELLENGKPLFLPIYVVFKAHSIEFNFQGKILGAIEYSDAVYNSILLFCIPLYATLTDELDTDIQRVFHHKINISPSNSLLTFEGEEKFRQYKLKDYLNTGLCYSMLEVFDLDNKEKWSGLTWDQQSELKDKFLRKLFLDFLDDFFNATVFKQAPGYHSTLQRLRSSNAISGIVLKANLYLNYELLKKTDEEDLPAQALYFEAMDVWTKFICDEKNSHLFLTDKEKRDFKCWFDFKDEELSNALIWSSKLARFDYKNRKEIIKRSVNELVRNYEVGKAALLIFVSSYKTSVISSLLILVGVIALRPENLYIKVAETNYGLGLAFLATLVIFLPASYQVVLRYLPETKYRINFLLLLLPLAGWGSWLFFSNGIEMLYASNWSLLIWVLGGFFFTGFIFFFFSLRFAPIINILLPRMQMAVITSWLAILPSLDIWKNYFDISIRDALKFGGVILLFTSSYILFEIKRNTKLNYKPKIVWKLLNVILPGYVLSLIIGTVGMTVMAKKYMSRTDYFESKTVRENIYELWQHDTTKIAHFHGMMRKHRLSKDTDATKNAILALSEYQTNMDSLEDKTKICKQKLIYSFHLIEDGKKSKQYFIYAFRIKFIPCDIMIMPGFLILMSAIALFSGIFLTLLFDDKPITDPL